APRKWKGKHTVLAEPDNRSLDPKKGMQEPPTFAPRGSSHPTGVFNLPPKKVVRAMMDYSAQTQQELSFAAGDFFYVLNDRDEWYYEAINPLQRIRGLVPTTHFELLEKVDRTKNIQPINTTGINQDDRSIYSGSEEKSQRGSTLSIPTSPYSAKQRPGSGLSDLRDPEYHMPFPGYAFTNQQGSEPMIPKEDRSIHSATIQNHEVRGGMSHFTLEIRRPNHIKHVLFRNFDDFWSLHISLLNHFPDESGRKESPRIIPFLYSPADLPIGSDVISSPGFNQQRTQQLNVYLEEIIKLPTLLIESIPMKRFFLLRNQDVETIIDINFDVSATLIDLISGYNEDELVKVKVCLDSEIIVWKIPDTILYEEFIEEIEDKFDIRLRRISYKDESNAFLPLRGDEDLQLLLRTYGNKAQFFID
ncbi:bud emergence protein 1, partial [Nowakowskiella sp. JEL0078]